MLIEFETTDTTLEVELDDNEFVEIVNDTIVEIVNGESGPTGTRGSRWTFGSGIPTDYLVNAYDYYLDTDLDNIYEFNGIGWVFIGNIQGKSGLNGEDGRTILNGTINPTDDLGINGDFYINTVTHYLWGPKTSGAWSSNISLVGPPGVQGNPGRDSTVPGPAGTAGPNTVTPITTTNITGIVTGNGEHISYIADNHANWDTAFSWGNWQQHQASSSQSGWLSSTDWNTFNNKLSSFTESDPIFTVSPAASISTPEINSWNGAVAWINAFHEQDPVFSAWQSSYDNHAHWDTAYSWGNHATVGYLTSSSSLDPSKVSQTSSYRFVTDTEKSGWNAKLTSPMTTLGDLIYENATPAAARLAGNTTTTKKYLQSVGDGSNAAAPSWQQIAYGDISGTPSLSGYVPYTGATGDVNLGAHNLLLNGYIAPNSPNDIVTVKSPYLIIDPTGSYTSDGQTMLQVNGAIGSAGGTSWFNSGTNPVPSAPISGLGVQIAATISASEIPAFLLSDGDPLHYWNAVVALQVQGLAFVSDGQIGFQSGWSDGSSGAQLSILANGNVQVDPTGIGFTDTGAALQVNGNLTVTETITSKNAKINNGGAYIVPPINVGGAGYPVLSIRDPSNQTYGFDFLQNTHDTGDMDIQSVVAGIGSTVMHFNRSDSSVAFGSNISVAGQIQLAGNAYFIWNATNSTVELWIGSTLITEWGTP